MVGEVQTKRMQRRNSITSQASAPAQTETRPAVLQRRDSGGSMTERTFREPSPNRQPSIRPASSHGPYPKYDQDAPPPVPAIPQNIALTASLRATSVDPPSRMSSPQLRKVGARGVSLDRGPGVLSSSVQTPKVKIQPDPQGILESPGSRNSINFSRPMSPQNLRPGSALASVRPQSPSVRGTQIPSSALSQKEVHSVSADLLKTADQSVKKRKPKAQFSAQGDHLASATVAERPNIIKPQAKTQPLAAVPAQKDETQHSSTQAKILLPQKKNKQAAASSKPVATSGESVASAEASDSESVTSDISATADRPKGTSARASGILAKQPSIVREDREGEQEAEQAASKTKKLVSNPSNDRPGTATPANTSKIVSKDRPLSKTTEPHKSQKKVEKISPTDDEKEERWVSLTPSRAAHFLAQPQFEDFTTTKHQPPARSASPAKPALKSSPSRGHSPAVSRGGLAPSEASDTASQISDDGIKSTKKKRNVRVSFDEESVLIGHSAGPPSGTDSPVISSPQGNAKPQSWFDLLRQKNRESLESESDEDSAIKPVPALPSFGSVRSREPKEPQADVDRSTPAHRTDHGKLDDISSSADLAIGGIINQELRENMSERPETTSVASVKQDSDPEIKSAKENDDTAEGLKQEHVVEHNIQSQSTSILPINDVNGHTGTQAATEASLAPLEPPTESSTTSELRENARSQTAQDAQDVPEIAVQPASPDLNETDAGRASWLGMPGGFPPTNETQQANHTTAVVEASPQALASEKPEITKETSGKVASGVASPAVEDHVEMPETKIQSQDEEECEGESDDSSIYSDAAEDQSEQEGDGFGSINAIVESPASQGFAVTGVSPPASPTRKGQKPSHLKKAPIAEVEAKQTATNENWGEAQSYWAGLSEARRQQLEQAGLPGAVDEPILRNKTMRGPEGLTKKKKKKTPRSVAEKARNDANTSINVPQTTQASVAGTTKTKKISSTQLTSPTRQEAANEKPKTSKKRNSAPPPATRAPPQFAARPMSTVGVRGSSKVSSQTGRPASMAASPASSNLVQSRPQKSNTTEAPALKRADSDSSSSFKKSSKRAPDNNRYSLRRSMRGGPNETYQQAPNGTRASSLSLRSASPTDSVSRRPFGGVGGGSMRMSMREPTSSNKPARTSLGSSVDMSKQSRTKSPSRFSFGRSGKRESVQTKPASRFSSRFADSSDEEGGAATLARSRFADSSSDEEEIGLTPVRGIPRRVDEGESTDLEDSSGIDGAQVDQKPPVKIAAEVAPPSEGTALASGSLRTPAGAPAATAGMGSGLQAKKAAEKEKKKRSFFGSFKSKKRDESSSNIPSPPASSVSQPFTATSSKELAPSSVKSSTTTNAKADSLAVTNNTLSPHTSKTALPLNPPSTTPGTTKNPKLQRRQTPKRTTSGRDISWPLPQTSAEVKNSLDVRPRTSDGGPPTGNAVRPTVGNRRDTVQSEADAKFSFSAPSTKKKRFPFFRKAFGLDT